LENAVQAYKASRITISPDELIGEYKAKRRYKRRGQNAHEAVPSKTSVKDSYCLEGTSRFDDLS
jgi:hypothetical protein